MMSLPGIDINCLGHGGMSLLHYTAGHGWVEISSLLLTHARININAKGIYSGRTPLHLAACSGRLEVVVLLLQQEKSDTRCQDVSKLTALQLAALHGHYHVARVLYDHEEMTAVSNAALNTPEQRLDAPCEIMEKCLSHHDFFDINLHGKYHPSQTPGLLHSAVRKGECGIIQILLRYKDINVNLRSMNRTPLYLAAELGQTDAARLLLQHENIDINLRVWTGGGSSTPLQTARKKGSNEIVELLLAKGARDDENSVPLNILGNVTSSDSTIHEVSCNEKLAENDLEIQSHSFLDAYMDDISEDVEDEMETDDINASCMDTVL
jgi:ankyrin repeat protein